MFDFFWHYIKLTESILFLSSIAQELSNSKAILRKFPLDNYKFILYMGYLLKFAEI